MKTEALDAYLRAATQGLFGKRRRLVREELHANIIQSALDLQLGGMSFQDALQLALRDFGPAWRVRNGMLRLYTLPVLLTTILIGSGLGTAAYALSTHETQTAPHQTAPIQ